MSPLRGLIVSHARALRAIIITVALLACGDSSSPTGPGGGSGGGGGAVGSIAISPAAPTVTIGGQLALQAQVKTTSGSSISAATVFWSSADTSIVMITTAGVVTGKALGTAEIAASSGGVSTRVVVTVVSTPVTSIVIAPTSATLVVGGTTVLQAVTSGADGTVLTGRTIVWASSAPQVAAIDATGNVIALSAGTASITATSEGKTATSTITVTVIPIASISIAPTSSSLQVGASTSLTAIPIDANGNVLGGRPVTWTSADPTIASVSNLGLVTAVAVGSATITATSEGKSGSASVTVSAVPVASIALNPTSASLNVGASTTITAVTKDGGGNVLTGRTVTWTSNDPSFATVSATGVVTGIAAGSATITATSEGQTATAAITVTLSPVASITLNPAVANLAVGSAATITAVLKDASNNVLTGRTITWVSDTPGVATVGADGTVSAVSAGTARITASSEGHSATSTITVSLISVATVVLNPTSVSLHVGGTTTLTAITKDANGNVLPGRAIAWASSDPAIATVNVTTGLITAIAPGPTTITATSEGKSGSASVTVSAVPVASIALNPTSASLNVGASTTITAVTKDAGGNVLTGRIITWISNTPSIATVSTAGVVTGIATGNALITATSEGQTATAAITVALAPVASITLNPTVASLAVGSATTITAVLKDASNNVLTGRTIVWLSNTPGVATVDGNGTVTAVSAGSAMITATSGGQSAASTITVSLVAVASVVLNPTSASLHVGGTTTLVATTLDASGNALTGRAIAWASSDPAIATVNATTGLITAIAAGTTTITATSEGKSGSASVTVSSVPVASIALTPTSASLTVGTTTTITAVTKDAGGNVLSGRIISWTSNVPSVATVSATGVVTGVGAGNTSITATSEGQSATSAITVTLAPVASVTLNPTSASLVVGSATTIAAVLKDASNNVLTGRIIAWVSNTPGVATVNASGGVTAVSAGTATITATSEGQSATSVITVSLTPVASVVVNPASANLYVDSTATLSATTKDANGNTLTGRVVGWTSNALGVATVNSTTGLITAVAPGTATITATSEGQHADASVIVTQVPVATVTVDQSPLTMVTDSSVTLTATVRDGNGHVLTGRSVAWQISATGIATIGITSGVLATTGTTGTATITATSEGKSGTAPLTVGPDPVGSVVLSPLNVGLQVPATTTIVPTVKDSHGTIVTGRTISWTSSNTAVASVDGSGVVTAVASGSATITATSEGKSGTTTVTVADPVATVIVTAPAATVVMYGTLQLADTTKNAAGTVVTGRTVTWTSGTPGVATVSSNGLVTAASPGTTAITATSEGIASNSVTITVTQAPVATVTVATATPSVQAGSAAQFTAAAKDSHGSPVTGSTITWSSDTPGVATVDANGLATAVAPGTANIKATSSDGPSGSAVLTVTAVPVASVTVTPPTASLIVGAATAITAVTKDAGGNVLVGRTITWASNTPGVATVDANGTVTAVSAGTATITATSEGQSGTSVITVTLPPVATVTLSPASTSLVVGSATTIAAVLKDANNNVLTGRTITWTSDTPGVATVDANGAVTAVSTGTATITATSEGQSGTSVITVTVPPVATVTLNPTSANLYVDSTTTLGAVTKDANGNVLTGRVIGWTSSAPTIATVDANTGLITAVAPGTATITATSEGQSAGASVVVSLAPVVSVDVTPAGTTLSLSGTTTATLTATPMDAGSNPLSGRTITWASSDPTIATVDPNTGVVTAVATGTVTITATCETVAGTTSVTVTS